MDLRLAVKCHQRLIEQRAAAQFGQCFDLFEVVKGIRGGHRELHKT